MLHRLFVLSMFTGPSKSAFIGSAVPFSPVTTTEYLQSSAIKSTLELYFPPNLSLE